ncbi:MAG: Inositol 2-dehydrogenase/D-chiro-inositol 3-dehydrogenase [Bryobacteraceae bacterium]|nr:Inositol 2-dehydrogenase/D-chiro-inositol 3-dehydrogenase [Bryobacteraceae bacterium]
MSSFPPTPRRDFLKASLAAGFPAVLSAMQSAKTLKVGLVGCGGRGTGAAAQALKADDYAELTAVADIERDHAEQCLERLRKVNVAGQRVKVEPSNIFLGLDAYQKVIDSGVDVVLLATPPGFRPYHLRACLEAGKHVFCEKPVATDAFGVRHALESAKIAREKHLSVMAGFCWRRSKHIKATFEQMKNGAIGNIAAYYATYYTSPVKPMPPASERPAGMSDVEWQIRNWYNFSYLCGDGLVEQAVHSADKIAWAMGDKPPISCVAVGGRQIPAEGGNIYDHFEVNYLYPNNVRAFLGCRQIEGCYNENSDYILGSKGTCTIGRGPLPRITGETNWTYTGERNDMYQAEHDELFAAIRRNQPVMDIEWMTTSTLLAMMGRMAAYTGQQITWDMALNSQERLFPEKLDWNGSFTPSPMPLPGKTRFI